MQDAVVGQFEIIGEAAKNLSPERRSLSPGVPWKDMAGMRDKLIHQYFGVDIPAVWESPFSFSGLKIPRYLVLYRFESGPGHQENQGVS